MATPEFGFNFFSPLFSRLIFAVFIILLGFILGRIVGLLVRRLLSDLDLDRHLRNVGMQFSLERIISGGLSAVIYILSVYWSLNTLGLTSTIVTILMFGIVFVVVISFLLAIKDFFPNLLSGMRIKMLKLFDVDDELQIKEVKGKVTVIGLLETRIVTQFKEEIIIPNALFTKRKILVKKHK